MLNISAESYLKTNTLIFAHKMCQSISDMVGVSFNVKEDSLKEAGFKSAFKMISYISFSGAIQGNYLCAMDEITALKIMGVYTDRMSDDEIRGLRSEHSGFVKEVLNLSVGQSIVEIEKNFGDLTFFPGTVVYGELEFPEFLSADVLISSDFGSILCGFSLNLANLRIGQKLDEALRELEKKTSEAQEAKRNISSILELLPVGLVAIDQKGTILPGHSKSTKSVIGIENDTEITGLYLPDFLQMEKKAGLIWKNWLELVFSKYGEIPFQELSSLCELKEIKNSRGKTLKLDWLAITNEKQGRLEKLLVVIEDVTRQRLL
ncbi:MAG: hypothetical protein GX640_03790, partial [Fibrobacter sp.]|nr:hypothetical protein [Fibrobacter sp.]